VDLDSCGCRLVGTAIQGNWRVAQSALRTRSVLRMG